MQLAHPPNNRVQLRVNPMSPHLREVSQVNLLIAFRPRSCDLLCLCRLTVHWNDLAESDGPLIHQRRKERERREDAEDAEAGEMSGASSCVCSQLEPCTLLSLPFSSLQFLLNCTRRTVVCATNVRPTQRGTTALSTCLLSYPLLPCLLSAPTTSQVTSCCDFSTCTFSSFSSSRNFYPSKSQDK